MPQSKRTYVLPDATVERFERKVPAGSRSAVLAHLIDDWLEEERLRGLRQEIAEGCHDMADVYLELEADFHPLEEEVHRGIPE